MKAIAFLVIALSVLGIAGTAAADIILSPYADVPTYSGAASANFNFDVYPSSSTAQLWTGTWNYSGNPDTNSYLIFNLPSLPGIQSAKLWLYNSVAGYSAANVSAYSTSADYKGTSNIWTENGLTWNNAPGVGTLASTTTVGSSTGWYSWDVTSLAQSAVDGKLYLELTSDGASHVYEARENTGGYTPYLSVTAVPEPVSMTLFLVGVVPLAVRKLRRK